MAETPTVYDVAARAGVSIATVSRALRVPDAVKPDTRRKVADAARALGYVPSGSARGLARKSTGVLGVCFIEDGPDAAPDHDGRGDSLYWDEVIRGLERTSWQRGFAVLIAAANATRVDALTNDIAGRVDGIAILAHKVPTAELEVIAQRIPVVVMAGQQSVARVDSVRVANSKGMRLLVEHAVGTHRYTDAEFIGGPADSPDAQARFAAFCRAWANAGRPAPDAPFFVGDFTFGSGLRAADALLDKGTLPRLVVCANDQTAIGLVHRLKSAGVRVPEDVAVTGFDGIEIGHHTSPPLTTVHQPMRKMGRLAVELLLGRLADPTRPSTSRTLPVDLAIRESCGCRQ